MALFLRKLTSQSPSATAPLKGSLSCVPLFLGKLTSHSPSATAPLKGSLSCVPLFLGKLTSQSPSATAPLKGSLSRVTCSSECPPLREDGCAAARRVMSYSTLRHLHNLNDFLTYSFKIFIHIIVRKSYHLKT